MEQQYAIIETNALEAHAGVIMRQLGYLGNVQVGGRLGTDVICNPEDAPRVIAALREAGYEAQPAFTR